MATEIELKAHMSKTHASQEVESLRSILSEKADYKFAFEKEDTYFFPSGASESFPSGLRLRSERRTLPDGTEEFETLLTHKRKKVRDGVEQNDEKEFEIRPSSCRTALNQAAVNQTAAEFRELLEALGLRPLTSKRKQGWAFSRNGIIAELLEVTTLGWFLELEIIAADSHENNGQGTGIDPEQSYAEGRQRLLDFLDSTGLARETIESRFYSEMLKDNIS